MTSKYMSDNKNRHICMTLLKFHMKKISCVNAKLLCHYHFHEDVVENMCTEYLTSLGIT